MKTAVEWLYQHLFPKQLDGFSEEEWSKIDVAFEQAKEMEKEQSLKKIIYDLDELASEYSEGKSTSEVFKRAHESDFKAGFQKAIELLTFKTTEQ
jgi:soluble cytochrome b562